MNDKPTSAFNQTAEELLAESLKFVKVTVEESTTDEGVKKQAGYLTDISVRLLMVEMERNGLRFGVQ
jgi:hypothetical protein